MAASPEGSAPAAACHETATLQASQCSQLVAADTALLSAMLSCEASACAVRLFCLRLLRLELLLPLQFPLLLLSAVASGLGPPAALAERSKAASMIAKCRAKPSCATMAGVWPGWVLLLTNAVRPSKACWQEMPSIRSLRFERPAACMRHSLRRLSISRPLPMV